MYRLQDIKPNTLRDIPIKGQKEIIEQTGSPLVLEDGYAIIKEQTQHFTIDDPLAKEADRLLFELYDKHHKEITKETVKKTDDKELEGKEVPLLSKEAVRIRENERLRAIRLLKLQLTLNPMSA